MTEPRGPRPALAALTIADPPESWRTLGFTVAPDGHLGLGGVTVCLGGPGRGITGWHVAGAPGLSEALGVAEGGASGGPGGPPATASVTTHPNGATGIDHVVVLTPDFDATAAALDAVNLPFRRIRRAGTTVRQGFRRLGPAILEVVEAPQAERPSLWGLVVIARELDAAVACAAPHVSEPRAAVQPGRRIAPVSSGAGLSTQLAFMDPEPGRPADRA